MGKPKRSNAAVLARLTKLEKKSYRDGFLTSQVRSSIAYQIRGLRQKLGLSQKEMAKRTGSKQSAISRLEDTEYGKVSIQTLLTIAKACDVALIVRFASYSDFLKDASRMSEADLKPDDIHETLRKEQHSTQKSTAQERQAATGAQRASSAIEMLRPMLVRNESASSGEKYLNIATSISHSSRPSQGRSTRFEDLAGAAINARLGTSASSQPRMRSK